MQSTEECTFGVVVAFNNEQVLNRDLLASPDLQAGQIPVRKFQGASNMAQAYNQGIDSLNCRYLVFCHQDVYLPSGWFASVASSIAEIERLEPRWAVLGCFGIDMQERYTGCVWSSGIGRELKHAVNTPHPVRSLDELVLILRADAGLRFDPDLPHFHLYGTDIVLNAAKQGLIASTIYAPVVHNSSTLYHLDGNYEKCYNYMIKKWQAELPIRTPVIRLSSDAQPLRRVRLKLFWKRLRKRFGQQQPQVNPSDPKVIAQRLGYE